MDEKKQLRSVKADTVHNIIMENRRRISVSGVTEVESFNEDEIILHTDMGVLVIKGTGLHINKLNTETGEVSVEGQINGLEYVESKAGKGVSVISRLFR